MNSDCVTSIGWNSGVSFKPPCFPPIPVIGGNRSREWVVHTLPFLPPSCTHTHTLNIPLWKRLWFAPGKRMGHAAGGG